MNSSEMEPASVEGATIPADTPLPFLLCLVKPEPVEKLEEDEREGGCWEDKNQAVVKDEIDIEKHSIEEDSEAASEQGLRGTDGPCFSLQNEQRPNRCEVCAIQFSNRAEMNKHMRYHKVTHLHKCEVCNKCFSRSGHLTKHLKKHTGEKPYQCKDCGKCYRWSSDLSVHLRTHTGDKPFKCKDCDKCYRRSGHLAVHVRTHTGERPFKCKICDKCFKTNSILTEHLKIHTGEKPYQCSNCDKRFSQRGHLADHLMRAHKGKAPTKVLNVTNIGD